MAMHDLLKRCTVCPDEITEGIPSISIIDNDDFLNDTLTGGGTAHHCNWVLLVYTPRTSQTLQATRMRMRVLTMPRLCPKYWPRRYPSFRQWNLKRTSNAVSRQSVKSQLLLHQVQSLSASEALFMRLLALTPMEIALMYTNKTYDIWWVSCLFECT